MKTLGLNCNVTQFCSPSKNFDDQENAHQIAERQMTKKILVKNDTKKSNEMAKLCSALFYMGASILIMIVNKIVLTSCRFPSANVLALGQVTTTVVVLATARWVGFLRFPIISVKSMGQIFPLPLLYAANMVTGLGGTKDVPLPMLTALRRFSILMTMVLEFYILGIKSGLAVRLSVSMMIIGALIASSADATFSKMGYTIVMLNNIFTAAGGVITKKKLESKQFCKEGLLFHSALYTLLPLAAFVYFTGELDMAVNFGGWRNGYFLLKFCMSCFMGLVLNEAIVQCTMHNSALTSGVIGCLKNIFVTYLGMIVGGDYVYSFKSYVGINVGVLGSLLYTWVTFRPRVLTSLPREIGSVMRLYKIRFQNLI